MGLLKIIVIIMTGWIATMWPTSWTGLIVTSSLAVMCLSLAYEQHRTSPQAGSETNRNT